MSKKIIFIGCGVVALVCVACIGIIVAIGGAAFFLTQGVADASDAYLEALKQGDYATAYELSAPNVQEELGSAEGLQRFVTENNFHPQSWNFNNRSVENNTGSLIGTVTLQNGVVVDTEMDFRKIDGEWLLTRIFFTDQ